MNFFLIFAWNHDSSLTGGKRRRRFGLIEKNLKHTESDKLSVTTLWVRLLSKIWIQIRTKIEIVHIRFFAIWKFNIWTEKLGSSKLKLSSLSTKEFERLHWRLSSQVDKTIGNDKKLIDFVQNLNFKLNRIHFDIWLTAFRAFFALKKLIILINRKLPGESLWLYSLGCILFILDIIKWFELIRKLESWTFSTQTKSLGPSPKCSADPRMVFFRIQN